MFRSKRRKQRNGAGSPFGARLGGQGTGDRVATYGVGWGTGQAPAWEHPCGTGPAAARADEEEDGMARPVARSRAVAMVGVVALAVAMVAGLAPAAGAAPPACRVKNPTQDTWFATSTGAALTRAIAVAHPVRVWAPA